MKTSRIALVVAVSMVAAAVPAFGWTYYELASWSTINGAGGSTQHHAAVIEGQTSYHQLGLGSSPRIIRVSNLNGAQTMTELVTPTQWAAAGGTTALTTYYGFGLSGDYVQFSDTGTDAIWRVNKNTGAVSAYVTKAQIGTLLSVADPQLVAPADTTRSGEFAVYESGTKNILRTNGAGNVSIFVSSADLATAAGTNTVSGGLTHDLAGNLYWGNNDSDGIYKRNTDGTFAQVISSAAIYPAISGTTTNISFKDIFAAPDGRIYFQDNTSGNVLRFSLANPAGTIETLLSGADLTAGPAASKNVTQFTWYNGVIAFNVLGAKGLYYLPEPASFALLALGGLTLARRRR